ncbi:MAG: hypothetical protein QW542_00490 [Thermoproteota archaeon]
MKMRWLKRKSGKSIEQGEFAKNLSEVPVSQAASASQAVYDYLAILNRSGASQIGDRVL